MDSGDPFQLIDVLRSHRYVSLEWLRIMKTAANRTKDRLDLENLPDGLS